jgi:hypothetical protein
MSAVQTSSGQIEQWRAEGGLLLDRFFDESAIKAARRDLEILYALDPEAELAKRRDDGNAAKEGAFHSDQLQAIRSLPAFATPALNLLALDNNLLSVVRSLLGGDVTLYSNYAWHKEAGKTNHNQPFHCDYPTHHLLVPPADSSDGSVNLFIYLTDVTPETGPLSYVPLSRTRGYDYFQAQPDTAHQEALSEDERSVTCPAGSVFLYNTRVYHRGTNLRGEGAIRDVVGAGFRRSDMPWIAPRHGAFHPMLPQWRELFEAADPDQLAALDVPRPGAPYWTAATIRGVESRYPGWRSDPWRRAAGLPLAADDAPAPTMEWPTVKDVSGVDLDALRDEVDRKMAG